MSLLDSLLIKDIAVAGVKAVRRNTLNLIAGAGVALAAADVNVGGEMMTQVTISSSAASDATAWRGKALDAATFGTPATYAQPYYNGTQWVTDVNRTQAIGSHHNWLGDVEIRRAGVPKIQITAGNVRLISNGANAKIEFYQDAKSVGYLSNVAGDTTAPALYLDHTFGAGVPRVTVSQTGGVGRGLIISGGAAGAGSGAAGGALMLRGGAKDGGATDGNVGIEDSTGAAYLYSDTTNLRIVIPRNLLVGVNTLASPTLRMVSNLDGESSVITYASGLNQFGSSGRNAEIFGNTSIILDVGGDVAEVISTGVRVASTKKYDTAGASWIASVGNTNVASSTTALWGFAQPISVTSAGAAVADTALIRTCNAASIFSIRNFANDGNLTIISTSASAANTVYLGNASSVPLLALRANTDIYFQIGGGATTIAIVKSGELEYQSGVAADFAGEIKLTRNGTDYITSSSGLVNIPIGTITMGSTFAGQGVWRQGNNVGGFARNAGNTNDIRIWLVNSSDDLFIGGTTVLANTNLDAGTGVINLRIGGAIQAVVRSGEVELQSNVNLQLLGVGTIDFAHNIALGGGATATMGTIGGSGPTAAAQSKWIQVMVDSVNHWIPAWI
jgi:hypothetical protein